MKNDTVSLAIIQLFEQERFYAELLSQMKRTLNPKLHAVAGVCIRDHIELHINPKLFEELAPKERPAVLAHECEHILRDHIGRFKELAPEVYENKDKDIASQIINNQKFKTLNISADCAINGTMKNLPEWGCFPKNFGLQNGETMEWYLANLKDNEKMKQQMQFDGHELWAESEGDKEILKEKIRQAVNKAASKTRAAGRMTAEHELLVSSLNQASVNWRDQLKRFAAKTMETKLESSKKKRNRRYGIIYPGAVKIEQLHIGVAIDTSGSVSNEALKQFMSEIGQIAKYATVSVIEADTEIKNAYIYDPKKTYKIAGRGGTAYKPAFDYFNQKKNTVDGMIYFGDMDAYDTEDLKKPKYPVLWAIVGTQNPPANFGAKIYVEVKSEV